MRTALPLAAEHALAERVAKRASLLDLGRAEHPLDSPDASAWQIVEVARMTSMTMPVGAAPASSGVKTTSTRTRVR